VSRLAVLVRRSLAIAAACALTGCYAEATTGADVEFVPPVANVEVYPHEYYDGHVVYLVNDRWYYRDGPHWVYYHREPPVLYQRRTVIRTRPTVVRERAVVHRAPPAHHVAPVRRAPPAHYRAPVRRAPPAHVERRRYRGE
jgi:hypothetical protein